MPFEIELHEVARSNLRAVKAFDRVRIIEEIEQQLTYQPDVETRNRKCLKNIIPDFEHVPPVWELRVGNYRVYYDVSKAENIVVVRTVRLKKQGQTTEDVLHEEDNH